MPHHIDSHGTFYAVSHLHKGVFKNPILWSGFRICDILTFPGAGTVIYRVKPCSFFVNLKARLSVCIKPRYTINQHVSAQLYILSVALNIFIITDVL